nr:MAG TPA_asm: hypothetical protein [Caudoviricetes sp.]
MNKVKTNKATGKPTLKLLINKGYKRFEYSNRVLGTLTTNNETKSHNQHIYKHRIACSFWNM